MSEDTRAIVAAVLAAAAVTGHTTVEHLIPIYEKALEQLAEAEKRKGDTTSCLSCRPASGSTIAARLGRSDRDLLSGTIAGERSAFPSPRKFPARPGEMVCGWRWVHLSGWNSPP
jgi:hypothetical protein